MTTKKQKRRSISIRGDIYDKVSIFCKSKNISMSSFVEDRILKYLENPIDELEIKSKHKELIKAKRADSESKIVTPPPPKTSNRQISELTDQDLINEMKQHFTF